jgi:NADH dehydrogenase
MAAIESDPEERRRLLTFVIAGGNYAGVEVATDLADYFRRLTSRRYRELKDIEFRVVLLEHGTRILPELGKRYPKLVSYAEKRVAELGIEVQLSTGLEAATAEGAVTSTGERISTRTIVTCTGMKSSPLLDQFPVRRDHRGRLFTDEFCRVPEAENVWAGGDCAAVPHPDGGFCPPLAHYAQKAGENIGTNILRVLGSRPLKKYSFSGLGEACTLGHRCAIAHMKGLQAHGYFAWVGWRFIVLTMFVPSWTRRIRLMSDWWWTLILGRDVVNPRIVERGTVGHLLYDAGQIIVAAGDTRPYHYLVESGDVEIISENKTLLASVPQGSYLGHTTRPNLDCSVRAASRVRLLVLDDDAAKALSLVRPDLAMLLKEGAGAAAACK